MWDLEQIFMLIRGWIFWDFPAPIAPKSFPIVVCTNITFIASKIKYIFKFLVIKSRWTWKLSSSHIVFSFIIMCKFSTTRKGRTVHSIHFFLHLLFYEQTLHINIKHLFTVKLYHLHLYSCIISCRFSSVMFSHLLSSLNIVSFLQ